ncbi:uncharacterized protein LOC132180584 [Corylus avellana]|uniref:uncharacterized protein LOC132180584 n=1 Tax=Corylus avellana TaxID=13451 RepID=UPI00286BB495|nr:uncharacterized protein LOC132180584 [Corylus avellana]
METLSLRAHFILQGNPDKIACKAFPLTLAGVAKEWFARLPVKSVDNFKSLGCLFLSQFLATRKRKKNSAYLLSLIQGNDESLKDFMLRFNKEKLAVEGSSEQTILNALMHGVRAKGPLMAELAKKSTLVTLRELQEKEEKNLKQQAKKTPYPRTDPQRKLSKFAPLNTSMTEVLIEIRRDAAFRWPTKLKGQLSKRDQIKFCEYHNDRGHLIEECVSLRQEMETFNKNGRLVRFLAGERNRGRNPQEPLLLEGNREALGGREPRQIGRLN